MGDSEQGGSPQDASSSGSDRPPDTQLRPDAQASSVPDEHNPLFLGVGAICDTATRLTGVDGAAVAVLAPAHSVRELVYATDALAQQIDELQFVLGEGPCLVAYQQRVPQTFGDLEADDAEPRWPTFAGEAAALGVAAVFAYPIPIPGPSGPSASWSSIVAAPAR